MNAFYLIVQKTQLQGQFAHEEISKAQSQLNLLSCLGKNIFRNELSVALAAVDAQCQLFDSPELHFVDIEGSGGAIGITILG